MLFIIRNPDTASFTWPTFTATIRIRNFSRIRIFLGGTYPELGGDGLDGSIGVLSAIVTSDCCVLPVHPAIIPPTKAINPTIATIECPVGSEFITGLFPQ